MKTPLHVLREWQASLVGLTVGISTTAEVSPGNSPPTLPGGPPQSLPPSFCHRAAVLLHNTPIEVLRVTHGTEMWPCRFHMSAGPSANCANPKELTKALREENGPLVPFMHACRLLSVPSKKKETPKNAGRSQN